jgi:hypothetical protein
MGTRAGKPVASRSSQTANPEAVFQLRYFHCWVAVVRRILGTLMELRAVVRNVAPCAQGRAILRLPGKQALP